MRRNGILATAVVLIGLGVAGLLTIELILEGETLGGPEPRTETFAPRMMRQTPGYGATGSGGMMGGPILLATQPATYTSNGERIFFTLQDASGTIISPTTAVPMVQMRGLTCADCHRADRTGGILMPDGSTASADISAAGLRGFTKEAVARAITKGIDEKGAMLSPWMPTWDMSARDLTDMVDYLKASP
jgi:hypothetical protein